MKYRIFSACILLFFIIMLLYPGQVLNGASTGLLLWFNVVLPTLLPFMILSNLLICTRAIHWITRISAPFLCRFFRVSPYGTFALLTGFLCGYPMGAKVTSDLLKGQYISANEAAYMLSFCNNTSPMFLISFVILQNLKMPSLTLPALGIVILSPVLCSFLFRRYYQIAPVPSVPITSPTSSCSSKNVIDSCIMDGFEAITKVGGYIMLFSILIEFAKLIPDRAPALCNILLPTLELTNGIVLTGNSSFPDNFKLLQALTLTSFGGFCCIAQTRSMIQGTQIPIFPYMIEKLITAMVTSLLTYCYLLFF